MSLFQVELIQDGKTTTKRVVKPGMDLTRTKLALDDMYLMLTSLLEYVDKIQVSHLLSPHCYSLYFELTMRSNLFRLAR